MHCRESVLSFLTHLKSSLSGGALSDHTKNFIIMMTGVTIIPLLFILLPPPWARSCRCHFPAGLVRTSSGLIRCSMVSGEVIDHVPLLCYTFCCLPLAWPYHSLKKHKSGKDESLTSNCSRCSWYIFQIPLPGRCTHLPNAAGVGCK